MLHCLKLKLKLHHTLPKKYIIISVASKLSFFTFNTKKQHKYFAYKYNISTSGILLFQQKKQSFECRELVTASLMGNSTWRRRRITLWSACLVNFGLLFWVVWDAVANGPLTIYCLTGLLFTQSACTYQKFRSPAWLALTHSVCVCGMCAAPECRQCSSRMYWKELSFAPKCFLIAYIFKKQGLKTHANDTISWPPAVARSGKWQVRASFTPSDSLYCQALVNL